VRDEREREADREREHERRAEYQLTDLQAEQE